MDNTFVIYKARDKYFQIIGGVFYMLLGASYFYNEISVFGSGIFIMYIIGGFIFIFRGVKHYTKTQIKCTEKETRIKWKRSIKSKVIQNKEIQEINLTREFIQIHNSDKNVLKYSTADFSNDERKSLLTFLKKYFNNRVTVN